MYNINYEERVQICTSLTMRREYRFVHLPQKRIPEIVVVSSGGAPTPADTSVFTKHNWDMGMGYLWLNGWGIYHLMGGAFMA